MAVERIEKVEPGFLRKRIKPLQKLLEAVKVFEVKYAKKHPDFTAAVELEIANGVFVMLLTFLTLLLKNRR